MKSPTKQTVINQTTTTQMIKFGINANVIIHGNVTSYGIKNH